jgi:hypothetical protein
MIENEFNLSFDFDLINNELEINSNNNNENINPNVQQPSNLSTVLSSTFTYQVI